jgi:hypothetical protein
MKPYRYPVAPFAYGITSYTNSASDGARYVRAPEPETDRATRAAARAAARAAR